jgi:2-hydroxy-3-keto-5-methylthiopentenyl-1-phosphate phosphatase
MKSQQEIQDKLNSLEDGLTRLLETLSENYDIEESLSLNEEIEITESRITLLKWILE